MSKQREVYVMQYPCLTRSAEDTLPSLIEALEEELEGLKALQREGGWVAAVEREADCGGCEAYSYSLCTTDPEVAEACGMEKAEGGEQVAAVGGSDPVTQEQDLDLDAMIAQFPPRPSVARAVAG